MPCEKREVRWGGSNLFFCLFLSGPDTKKFKIPVFFQTKKYKKIQKNTKKYLKIWVPDKILISSKTGSVYACIPLRNIFSFNFMHLGFLKVLIYELSGAADRRTPDRIYEKVHVLETWKSKQSCKTSLIQLIRLRFSWLEISIRETFSVRNGRLEIQ